MATGGKRCSGEDGDVVFKFRAIRIRGVVESPGNLAINQEEHLRVSSRRLLGVCQDTKHINSCAIERGTCNPQAVPILILLSIRCPVVPGAVKSLAGVYVMSSCASLTSWSKIPSVGGGVNYLRRHIVDGDVG